MHPARSASSYGFRPATPRPRPHPGRPAGRRSFSVTAAANLWTLALLLLGLAQASTAGAQTPAPPVSTPPAPSAALASALEPSATALSHLVAQLADDDAEKRRLAIIALGDSGEADARRVLDAFAAGDLYLVDTRVLLASGPVDTSTGKKLVEPKDPLTGEKATGTGLPDKIDLTTAKGLSPTRKERLLVRDALTVLQFADRDPNARIVAITRAGDTANAASLKPLRSVVQRERDSRVKAAAEEAVALIELATGDAPTAAAAASRLADLGAVRALPKLTEALARIEDPALKQQIDKSRARIESWQSTTRWISVAFSGLSLGSVLVLMALGLSVIFGLMGVINMAHGELMMIGAYATFLVQQAFVAYLPERVYDLYFVLALPLSFIAAGLVGAIIEAVLIRRLYGRPLETLLATWGLGLILIQSVRLIFGDNIAVNSPTWLRGGAEVLSGVILPYNRCFIIVLCAACVVGMHLLLSRTRLGLLIRSTTQNRDMAGALGVNTRSVDLWTFALGAGLAGVAGCALTQIGGVSPDMGQNYIVDSFLTVVTGGVGKLAGAVWAGMGLGTIGKVLEPLTQAVWAKVIVLILVVLFLQRKPSGLFPAKGRTLDA